MYLWSGLAALSRGILCHASQSDRNAAEPLPNCAVCTCRLRDLRRSGLGLESAFGSAFVQRFWSTESGALELFARAPI